jgi:hypothetical protein
MSAGAAPQPNPGPPAFRRRVAGGGRMNRTDYATRELLDRNTTVKASVAAAQAPVLQATIRDIVLNDETPPFDKRRLIRDQVRDELLTKGFLCRTADDRAFYFTRQERRLYDIEQRAFQHLLSDLSGLSATETQFRFVLDSLQTQAARTKPLAVHTHSYYDPATGLLCVSDGAGGVWRRERAGAWELADNGEDGILFFTEPDAQPWVPEFADSGGALAWFLQQFMFDAAGLTPQEQQLLFLIFTLQTFFPALRRTRIIPAALGPQGSGKTSACKLFGMLFGGPRFDVTGLSANREDAFVAAVCNCVVVALDNADSRIPWLEDALATYATGQLYRLRRLYTTNEAASYSPRAILLLSSRDPHFRRPDVAERLLPLTFSRPEVYKAESELFGELLQRRGAIMGELLSRAGTVADALARVKLPNLPFRMADFASFGYVVAHVAGKGQESEWLGLLKKLEASQMQFAGDGDSLISILRTLLGDEGKVGPIDVGELYRKCSQVAQADSLPFAKTAQGFGKHLTNMRRVIEIELQATFSQEHLGGNRRFVTIQSRKLQK